MSPLEQKPTRRCINFAVITMITLRAGAVNLDKTFVGERSSSPVDIIPPTPEASDSMKASVAISRYLKSSASRDVVAADAIRASTVAPATYLEHLKKLIVAHNATANALAEAAKLQETASNTAQSEEAAAQTEYAAKETALGEGRIGADFKSEAADLKLAMGR
eukprot:TRINITY_DN3088_c0_g1_i1.p1 TRINITY_DN3088_c0_g1~~TRINITY_DN3088_c0_g1_i1.p1  ORF type:complete len:191 (-),score=39.24 TRINITY_DN3088_c0_g1_i1:227-715(-)